MLVIEYIKDKFRKLVNDLKESFCIFMYIFIVLIIPIGLFITLVECGSKLFLLAIPIIFICFIIKSIRDDYREWKRRNNLGGKYE